MWKKNRAEILARVLLTAGALLPYLPLLKLSTIYVTDDFFASDIFHGELPFRVLVGEALKRGEVPVWTDRLCSGTPIGGSEPIGLVSFAALPPAAALDVFLIVMLLVAAHGTYAFARRIGATRPGAVLGGLAFAGSGYLACQLKHLGIVSTVVWLPVGLTLLEGALSQRKAPLICGGEEDGARDTEPSAALRTLRLALFGLVFAEQLLAGFPQSAYICALVYGAYAVFRAFTLRGKYRGIPVAILWLGAAGVAVAAAMLAGAMVIWPLFEAARGSPRIQGAGFEWASMKPYWLPNVLTFLIPYINGDVSDDTYGGASFFWEDYGYVGAATFVLAAYGLVRERRRPHVLFLGAMTLSAYFMVLGSNTPVFYLAWKFVPGISMFRFPTRFLVVVDLGLALLGAIGLARLASDLTRWLRNSAPKVPRWVTTALCVGTALDLFIHQPRQNPMVPASQWLAPPEMARLLREEGSDVRTLTLQHRELHQRLFRMARGWADLDAHYAFRESLQPNTGAYWGIASADCYAGIAPSWVTNTWGDHNEPGILLTRALRPSPNGTVPPPLATILGTLGVTHVISPHDLMVKGLTRVASGEVMNLYRVEGARRLRFVTSARRVADDTEAADLMLDSSFSPNAEVLVHDPPPAFELRTGVIGAPGREEPGQAVVIRRASSEVEIEATAPSSGGYLFLAETYYPEWVAQIDGRPTPVARANITGRAVWVPPGVHKINYSFQIAPSIRRALWMSGGGLVALLAAAAVAGYLSRREARRTSPRELPQ